MFFRDTVTNTDKLTTERSAQNDCTSEEMQLKAILTNRVDPCDANEFLSEITTENGHRETFTYPTETVSYDRDHRSYMVDDLNLGLNSIRVVCPWC